MLKIPAKGSIGWIDLKDCTGNEALAGVSIGVKYVGGRVAREWSLRALALNLQNTVRMRDLRATVSREEAPEIYAEYAMAHDTILDWVALVGDVAKECVAGLNGVDVPGDASAAIDFVTDMDLGEMIMLYYAILRMQSPTRREIFTSDPGGTPPG